MPKQLEDGSIDINNDGVGDYCPAGANCDYNGPDRVDDPYASTKAPKDTLPRKDYIEQRIRPDPIDSRKKVEMNIKGTSMWPELKQGDKVKVYVDSKITDAKVGDYVTFIANNRDGTESYYTHKVVRVNDVFLGGRELVTRGVNNSANDRRPTDSRNFIGVTRKSSGVVAGE